MVLREQLAVNTVRSQLRTFFPVTGWLYVGAGAGSAFDETRDVPHLVAIEAVERTFLQLTRAISRNPNWHARHMLVGPNSDQHILFEASSSRESGLVDPAELTALWPNLHQQDSRHVCGRTLEDVLAEEESSGVCFNWLTVDCLPGVDILRGLGDRAGQFDVIEVRATNFEMERTAWTCSGDAIEALLASMGFARRVACTELHPGIQHLFFVRNWRSAYETEVARGEAAQGVSGQREIEYLQKIDRLSHSVTDMQKALDQANSDRRTIEEDLERARLENSQLNNSLRAELNKEAKFDSILQEIKKQGINMGGDFQRLFAELPALDKTIHEKMKLLSERVDASKAAVIGIDEFVKSRLGSSKSADMFTELSQALEKFAVAREDKLEKALVSTRKSIERVVRGETSNSTKQIEAYLGIQDYIRHGTHLPPFHGWPISPDFALFMLDMLDRNRYDVIVEFGSGSSTLLLASSRERLHGNAGLDVTQHLAFEHSEKYYEETLASLKRRGLDNSVRLVHAPLQSYAAPDNAVYDFYNCRSELADARRILTKPDARILVIVDGPPAATGPHARYPALPIILESFSGLYIDVLLDDYSREDEKEVAQKWAAESQAAGFLVDIEAINLEKDACFISIRPK